MRRSDERIKHIKQEFAFMCKFLSLSIKSAGWQRSKKEGKFAVFGTVVVLGTTSAEYGKSCLLKGVKHPVYPLT